MAEWTEEIITAHGYGKVHQWSWGDWVIERDGGHFDCYYRSGKLGSFWAGDDCGQTANDPNNAAQLKTLALAKKFCEAGQVWLEDERWRR